MLSSQEVFLTTKYKGVAMIIALSGPSGIGKGYVKDVLLKRYPFIKEIAWITTRQLRLGETNSNRVSVSKEYFNQLVNMGKITLVQDIYGHGYGVSYSDLMPCDDYIRITELHPDNILRALDINPHIIIIGLIPVDQAFLYERLAVKRNTETAEEIAIRLQNANHEIKKLISCKAFCKSIITISQGTEKSVPDSVDSIISTYILNKGGRRET